MSEEESEATPGAPQAYRPRPAFDYEAVRALIAREFKVYEADANVGGVPGHEIAAFYVQADQKDFSRKFEAVRAAIRKYDSDLMVILQSRMGEDVLLVARKPPVSQRGAGFNIILFIATIITTTLAGAIFYAGYEQAEGLLRWFGADVTFLHSRYLALGFLSFSLPVMAILGIHELGHFFVAKRHHVRTSFPYFIPVPPVVPIGTFGAFISIREPIPDRKALFDIGASGPAAGFLATLPVLVIGLLLTSAVAQPIPPIPEVQGTLLGPDGTRWDVDAQGPGVTTTDDEIATRGDRIVQQRVVVSAANASFFPGNWTWTVQPVFLEAPSKATLRVLYRIEGEHMPSEGFKETAEGNYSREAIDQPLSMASDGFAAVTFNVPENATLVLAEFQWVPPPSPIMSLGSSILFEGFSYLFPTPDDVLIHPTGFAGWVGLLVTGFNLLPAGQLDGGHVARSVLGNKMKWASYASIVAMIALSYLFTGWLVLAVLILLLGVRHPPPLNDKTPLDGRRKFLAFLVLLMLAVSFIPIPFSQ